MIGARVTGHSGNFIEACNESPNSFAMRPRSSVTHIEREEVIRRVQLAA